MALPICLNTWAAKHKTVIDTHFRQAQRLDKLYHETKDWFEAAWATENFPFVKLQHCPEALKN